MISESGGRMQGAESLWGAEGGKCFSPLRSPSRRTPSKARGTPPTTPLAYAGSWNPDACRLPTPLFQAFAVSWWRDAFRWRAGRGFAAGAGGREKGGGEIVRPRSHSEPAARGRWALFPARG